MAGTHDRLFRYTFNPPARAEVLLRYNLPERLVSAVDWSSLRRESGTLTDWDRETRPDLLFSARYLGSAEEDPPHFFGLEHQSEVERFMALRAHDYAWRRIQHWRETHPGSLFIPEVSSVVVFPRQGREWTAPLRLEEHYWSPEGTGGERSGPGDLRSRYRLDRLSSQSERKLLVLPGPALVPLTLLLLRHAGTEELAQRLRHWRELFSRVHASSVYGEQQLYRLAHYVHRLGDERAYRAMMDVLDSVVGVKRAEDFMRTMAEVHREQGRQQGLAEGEARGEARGLTKGEAQGLAKAVFLLLEARGVRVDDASRQRIQGCMDVATLECWHKRALTATRISEVLEGAAQ